MNLSFAGCGFLGIYHVGVASCFKEYAPHIIVNKIAGASVGSVAAAALISGVSLGESTSTILSLAVKARSPILGPLSPRFNLNGLILESLEKALPPNAHIQCNGRLFISVTRLADRKNVLISEYQTREELKQALLCSCFIPFYSGIQAPTYRGVKYVDGGISDNLPVLDDNTITVSPFSGEHDICPQDRSCNIIQVNVANTSISISAENIYRFYRILFPPEPEIMSKMCQQGFDDALKYLQRKNVISCTRCIGIQSSLVLAEPESESWSENNNARDTETNPKSNHVFDNCEECNTRKKIAHTSNLPVQVMEAIEEVCEQVNNGVIAWLLGFAPVKWLSYIGKPYIVPMAIPVDITLVIFGKVYEKLPNFQREIREKFTIVSNVIQRIRSKFIRNRHLHSAKFSCQLAITEFDYSEDNVSSYPLTLENSKPYETSSNKMKEMFKRKLSFKTEISTAQLPKYDFKKKRNSYGGSASKRQNQSTERMRRKSLMEISQPERIIRNMTFGFTVDNAPIVTTQGRKKSVVEALQSLREESNEINVIELANKALRMEREYICKHQEEIAVDHAETIDKILSVPQSEAVMSYYYVDKDKSVKITELYNVTDADTSTVLPDEERNVINQLSCHKDWIHRKNSFPAHRPSSVTDTLDDTDFITSDDDVDLGEIGDSFIDKKEFTSESKKNIDI